MPPAFRPYFDEQPQHQPHEPGQQQPSIDEGVPGTTWDLLARAVEDATRKQERQRWELKRQQLAEEFAARVAKFEADHQAFIAQLEAKDQQLADAAQRYEQLSEQHVAWEQAQRAAQERERQAWHAQQQYERAAEEAAWATARAEHHSREALEAADAHAAAAYAFEQQPPVEALVPVAPAPLEQPTRLEDRSLWFLLGGALVGLVGLWLLIRSDED